MAAPAAPAAPSDAIALNAFQHGMLYFGFLVCGTYSGRSSVPLTEDMVRRAAAGLNAHHPYLRLRLVPHPRIAAPGPEDGSDMNVEVVADCGVEDWRVRVAARLKSGIWKDADGDTAKRLLEAPGWGVLLLQHAVAPTSTDTEWRYTWDLQIYAHHVICDARSIFIMGHHMLLNLAAICNDEPLPARGNEAVAVNWFTRLPSSATAPADAVPPPLVMAVADLTKLVRDIEPQGRRGMPQVERMRASLPADCVLRLVQGARKHGTTVWGALQAAAGFAEAAAIARAAPTPPTTYTMQGTCVADIRSGVTPHLPHDYICTAIGLALNPFAITDTTTFWELAVASKRRMEHDLRSGAALVRLREMALRTPSNFMVNNYGSYQGLGFRSQAGPLQYTSFQMDTKDEMAEEDSVSLLAYTFCDVMSLTLVYESTAYTLDTAQYIMAVILHCLQTASIEDDQTFATVKATVADAAAHK